MTGCEQCRERLSADLDGEFPVIGDPAAAARLDAAYSHVAGCGACTRWLAGAARVNRLVRTRLADPGPGFSDAQLAGLLAHLPARSRVLSSRLARVALALVGGGQVALGVLPLVAPVSFADPQVSMMGAGMIHMAHEFSAWNLALGIGFLVGAGWTRHLAGALPVLASFAAVLCAVTTIDVLQGRVDSVRVVSHLLILAGIVLILAILANGSTRLRPEPRPGLWARAAALRDARAAGPGRVADQTSPRPAARYEAA